MIKEIAVTIRTLLKRPGYAVAVVLTLALGIGGTTLMFSVVDAALLRPLPFDHADRLVYMMGVAGPQRSPRGGSFPEVADWRSLNETLSDVSLYDESSLNLRVGSEVTRVDTEMVNAGYFGLVGTQAALGRTFLPQEDTAPDRDAVAVISHRLWQQRFGADPAILTRTISLNERVFAIVGVMPEGFTGISFDTDVWIPSMMVTLGAPASVVNNRTTRWLGAIARLRTGVSLERAQEDLNRVAALLEERHPDVNRERGVQLTGLRQALVGDTRETIVGVFAAVLLFLAVACANVAGLQLARATSRRRELAVRLALGATRWHVLRQLLIESIVLALMAGIVGVLAAAWASGLASLMPSGALPTYVNPAIDLRAVFFGFSISALAGVIVSILPSLAATRGDLTGSMKEGARSAGPGIGSIRRPSAQQALVVAEIALAMTMLTAAGLTVRSLERQMSVRLGFVPDGVTVARLTLPAGRYRGAAERAAFVDRLTEQLRVMPGVRSAAIATSLPFTGNWNASLMIPEGAAAQDPAQRYYRNAVTPDFFSTLGIAIKRGRTFTAFDRAGAPLVAIINESAARRLWGTDDAVGRRFHLGTLDGPAVEVVGIAADARFRNLTTDLSAARVEPDVYFPFAQRTDGNLEIAVRTQPGDRAEDLQRATAAVDGSVPLYRIRRLEDALREQTSTARFGSTLLTAFSAGALLLAAIGLYGLISYIVGLNFREIGIRLALGADARRIVGLVVGNGLALVATGLALGVIGAAVAGRGLEAQLFQTRAIDPLTYASVATVLVFVTVIACVIPTRRAVGVDPQSALRAD